MASCPLHRGSSACCGHLLAQHLPRRISADFQHLVLRAADVALVIEIALHFIFIPSVLSCRDGVRRG